MTQHYDVVVDPRIAHLKDEELSTMRESLRQLIPLRIDGIHYADGRCGQLASLGGAMLSVGIAVFPLSNLVAWKPGNWALLTFGVCAVLGGLVTWSTYVTQVNYPYPFVSQERTWKWFYHQALPDTSKFGPTIPILLWSRVRRPRLAAAKQATKRSASYKKEEADVASQYAIFAEQVDGLSQARVDATQDLRQLYLLHLNELYKNRFLTQLRTVLSVGFAVAVVVPAVVLGTTAMLYHAVSPTTSSRTTTHGVDFDATWAATGITRTNGISSTDIQYRLTIEATNRGSSQVDLKVFTALDGGRRPIPAEFSFQPIETWLRPGASTQIVGYMWLPSQEARRLVTVALS